METENYTVNRQFAADILNVSVRTLDRYAKKDSISAVRKGRQLFFNEQELLDYKAKLLAREQFERVQARRENVGSSVEREGKRGGGTGASFGARRSDRREEFADVQQAQVMEQEEGEFMDEGSGFSRIRDAILKRTPEEKIYKGLYEKVDEELREARGKLEMANYQVGRLESQVKSMVPLIEFKKQKQELLSLSEENRFKQKDIEELERQVNIEKFVKKVYAGFLFFMMAILPLLVILRLFS